MIWKTLLDLTLATPIWIPVGVGVNFGVDINQSDYSYWEVERLGSDDEPFHARHLMIFAHKIAMSFTLMWWK